MRCRRNVAEVAPRPKHLSRTRSRICAVSTSGDYVHAEGVFALAGDTDGVDGAEEIAGAIVTPDTLVRAVDRGINAKARLADNDGHSFFEALGDQIITGPTLTNVNDFRAILILQAQERPAR